MALAKQGDYRESLNEYFRTGVQRGFKDLCAATDILEDFVWSDRWATHNEQLQVFVTHDINVGNNWGGALKRVVISLVIPVILQNSVF